MKEILIGFLAGGILFLVSLGLLIYATVQKKRRLLYIGLAVLGASVLVSGFSAYVFVKKSYRHTSEMFAPRTGREIYVALFGEPEPDCIRVPNYLDQTVPILDIAILLEVETCPQELVRILARRPYTYSKESTQSWETDSTGWFNPKSLGDSVSVFRHYDEIGNGQELYVSPDSTRLFCRDIVH